MSDHSWQQEHFLEFNLRDAFFFIGKFAFGSFPNEKSPHKSGQSKQTIMVLENIKTFFSKIITKHIFI